MITFKSERVPFSFQYLPGWEMKEVEGTVSLWKPNGPGAVTISSVINRDQNHLANALEHCGRFSRKYGIGDAPIEGGARRACSAFDLEAGGRCKVVVVAEGPRVVLATYNSEERDEDEEREAGGILDSVVLTGYSDEN